LAGGLNYLFSQTVDLSVRYPRFSFPVSTPNPRRFPVPPPARGSPGRSPSVRPAKVGRQPAPSLCRSPCCGSRTRAPLPAVCPRGRVKLCATPPLTHG
jgi:hypothetical protein